MDIVFIRELKVQTVIGAFEWERAIRQTVVMDLELASQVARAAATDHLEDALDYKAVANRITSFVEGSGFHLVESLAEAIANILQQEFGVTWLRLRISKPAAVRNARDVGVLIERGKREG